MEKLIKLTNQNVLNGKAFVCSCDNDYSDYEPDECCPDCTVYSESEALDFITNNHSIISSFILLGNNISDIDMKFSQ